MRPSLSLPAALIVLVLLSACAPQASTETATEDAPQAEAPAQADEGDTADAGDDVADDGDHAVDAGDDHHGDHDTADSDDDHAGHHDADDQDDDTADVAAGGTTEATLAQMQAMSPEQRAAAHDHHDDHEGHDDHEPRVHPNGVRPDRIVIPAIDVDADVIELGIDGNGEMEVPTDFAQTGWFRPGPPPGRVGPAVIAGHVDSSSGPAVFFRLGDLSAGDRIEVHGDADDPVVFEVREIERHAKDEFPTEKVYSGTPGPELRLITCDGEFDEGARSYRDNLIVYAERVDV